MAKERKHLLSFNLLSLSTWFPELALHPPLAGAGWGPCTWAIDTLDQCQVVAGDDDDDGDSPGAAAGGVDVEMAGSEVASHYYGDGGDDDDDDAARVHEMAGTGPPPPDNSFFFGVTPRRPLAVPTAPKPSFIELRLFPTHTRDAATKKRNFPRGGPVCTIRCLQRWDAW